MAVAGPGTVHSALQQQPLPSLTTQELEQIMELQRALNMDRTGNDGAVPQSLNSLQFLNSLTNEVTPPAVKRPP